MSLVELMRFETVSGFGETEEERALAEAMRQEHQRGFQEGMAEMEQKYQQETASQARNILSRIGALCGDIQIIEARMEGQAGDIAAAAINSVLPELSQRGMADEMALAVRELIGRLELPHLRISAPGVLIDALRHELEETGENITIPLDFEIDEAAGDGRAKLEWPRGCAEFDHGDMLTRVTRSLEKLMTPRPDQNTTPTAQGATQ